MLKRTIKFFYLLGQKAYWFLKHKYEYFYNWLCLKKNHVSFEQMPYVNGKLYVRNKGKIIIGRDVVINSCLSSNPIGFDSRTLLIAEENGEIIIGNGVKMSNCCIYSHDSIKIEDNVYIGGGAKVYDSDFHSLFSEIRNRDPHAFVISKEVHINRNAFIGAGALILKGITVGAQSVVGAGSVVSKDVPENTVVAGNPAGTIRKLEIKLNE